MDNQLINFLTGTDKPFFIDEIRKQLNEYLKEEMSFSRFVELLNEKVYHWKNSQPAQEGYSKLPSASPIPALRLDQGYRIDSVLLDWLESVMTDDREYCEVFFAGLRDGSGKAGSFQIESNPERFPTDNANTIRGAILKAMANYNPKNILHYLSKCDCTDGEQCNGDCVETIYNTLPSAQVSEAVEFAEWLELEGYRIKGMDNGQRQVIYNKFLNRDK